MIILYHDRFIERQEANVDIEDRAYQFGDGIYEVVRVYGGKPFCLQEHLERFERNASEIRISLPYSISQLEEHLLQLIKQNQLADGNLYFQISRGTSPRNHAFSDQLQPLIIAYTQTSSRPVKELEYGVGVISDPDIRWLRCDIKSLNLLGAVLSKQKAIDHQCHEAILVRDGHVTEGSSTNIYIVKEGTIWTHPANHLILPGITRAITLQLATQCNIPFNEKPFTLEDLYTADECFLTSTTMEICPIVQVDQKQIGSGMPGPVTKKLQEAFNQEVANQCHS
ncbi:D-amino-acid transaminase [Hazenella coriacea]|uniref:D-alanine aminotransferase n=1 Tax=Hazenella coriacea TaxID=1179467 RepID=A0A4R3LAX1_9BACL|nr:D-amino-acid transaminase [Hazenella coriacea]TCS96418.1 D-alanine aminotransferase [Hazenella coriacea]